MSMEVDADRELQLRAMRASAAVIRQIPERAADAQHLTAHSVLQAREERTGKQAEVFVFVTAFPDAIAKARAVLEEAGVLCHDDIGAIEPCEVEVRGPSEAEEILRLSEEIGRLEALLSEAHRVGRDAERTAQLCTDALREALTKSAYLSVSAEVSELRGYARGLREAAELLQIVASSPAPVQQKGLDLVVGLIRDKVRKAEGR